MPAQSPPWPHAPLAGGQVLHVELLEAGAFLSHWYPTPTGVIPVPAGCMSGDTHPQWDT